MPIDSIRPRIESHLDWLSNVLETDANFERRIVDLIDSIRTDGYDIRVTVRERENPKSIVIYQPRNASNPSGRPQDSKRTTHGSIECEIEAWRASTAKLRPEDIDTISRGLSELVGRHWGDRDSGTLLPYLKLPGIEPRFVASVKETGSSKGWIAVLHTDLDNFKAVNTEFTEEGGDAVLREFGARLREGLGELGIVVRTGGEEFSGLFGVNEPSVILERIEAFRSKMERVPFERIHRPNTCSIGLAIYRGLSPSFLDAVDVNPILAEARAAEQQAKREGKNCIRLAGPPRPAWSPAKLERNDLIEAALAARGHLQQDAPNYFSSPFVDFIAATLARRMVSLGRGQIAHTVTQLVQQFGIQVRPDKEQQADSGLVTPAVSVTEWAALAARALFRSSLTQGNPLKVDDRLELGSITDGHVHRLYLTIIGSSSQEKIELATLERVVEPLDMGPPWYLQASAPQNGIVRWLPTEGSSEGLRDSPTLMSPCLLMPIGDEAIAAVQRYRRFAASVVEIDDRPVVGGGLPDFWQSNLARVIRACLLNPNIRYILAIGNPDNAAQTFQRLRMTPEEWAPHLPNLARRLSLSYEHLDVFRRRGIVLRSVGSSRRILPALLEAYLSLISEPHSNLISIDLAEESRHRRRLQSTQPANIHGLSGEDGLRARSLADAYPQAIQLLRISSAEPQTEPTGRKFREFSSFKLVLADPFSDEIPDYWADEIESLKNYVKFNFESDNSLFGSRLKQVSLTGLASIQQIALTTTVAAIRERRPTRRVLLPISLSADRPDQPLGLTAIQILPRLRDGRWHLDFQWVWRTVEALVGFPFSAYGSISWSRSFHEEVRAQLAQESGSAHVALGQLTYVALSFHMFLDVGDVEIARAIIQDASD
jgi:diguanylate cyclase (GGDEF)-like protein